MDIPRLLTRTTTSLIATTLVGLMIGALVGVVIGTSHASHHTVSAIIRLHPAIDPDTILLQTSERSDVDAFISGEIAFLDSPGFHDAVSAKAGVTGTPLVVATQDGTSSLVTLSATSSHVASARRTVKAAVEVYSSHATRLADERSTAALNALDSIISRSEPAGAADSLAAQRNAIAVQLARGTQTQIVQEPTVVPPSGLPAWELGLLAGGLIGGFAALGGALVWRKHAGVVTSIDSLIPLVEGAPHRSLVTPEIRLPRDTAAEAAGRRIFAQVAAPTGGTVIVVGASKRSGWPGIAQILVGAADEFNSTRTAEDVDSRPVTVVDAGSMDSSAGVLHAMHRASRLVVVTRRGHDTVDDVAAACSLGTGYGNIVPTAIVCVRCGRHGARARADAQAPDALLHHALRAEA